MGLLSLGTPMNWDETKQYADLIRKRGITQFINIHRKIKDRKNDCLKWGDEVRTSPLNNQTNPSYLTLLF